MHFSRHHTQQSHAYSQLHAVSLSTIQGGPHEGGGPCYVYCAATAMPGATRQCGQQGPKSGLNVNRNAFQPQVGWRIWDDTLSSLGHPWYPRAGQSKLFCVFSSVRRRAPLSKVPVIGFPEGGQMPKLPSARPSGGQRMPNSAHRPTSRLPDAKIDAWQANWRLADTNKAAL